MEFEFKCPNCEKKFKREISKLKKGTKINCPKCNMELFISDDGFSVSDKEIRSFMKTIKKLS